ncbi:MAG: ABC transporter ATP-binding protein [Myxococcota bacterium]|nr:ABC transporter ATP-binding protein [Myxococcota bacterium]
MTASYGALAGPLLKALFGGTPLAWPAILLPYLPPPPSVETLRSAIPLTLILCAFCKGVAQNRYRVWQAILVAGVNSRLRTLLHQKTVRLSPAALSEYGTPDIISRATHDVEAVGRLVGQGTIAIVRDGLQIVFLCLVCLIIDWQMALIIFLVYPLAFWPIIKIGKRLRKAALSHHDKHSILMGVIDDHFRRSQIIQLAEDKHSISQSFEAANLKHRDAHVKESRVAAWSSPITEILGAVALAVGVVFTIHRVETSSVAPEHVMSFLAAVLLLYQPVKNLGRIQAILEPGRAALIRINAVLSDERCIPTGGHLRSPEDIQLIRCSRVSFSHGSKVVFQDLNCVFRRGDINFLVGPNGAGKSTLAWMVAGLLTTSDGEIWVDEHRLSDLNADQWRRGVGWVAQDTRISGGTIRHNLRFGHGPCDEKHLLSACQQAGLERMLATRSGLETDVGHEGQSLSGGERRRLAIARALLGNPRILILDEPTTHLDQDSTSNLRDTLATVADERLVIVITHDRGWLKASDRVVELGRHSQAAGDSNV